MSEKILKIKYRCQHGSCQVFCKKGALTLEEDKFNELSDFYDEEGLFKSPRDACRMGFSQPFKVISVEEESLVEDSAEEEKVLSTTDPIDILMTEHKVVIAKLDLVESQVKKRQLEDLWISTADLENEIMLHSIKKEEGALFPLLEERMPVSNVYMQIVQEDHKEFISLLHSFRCGLQEDEILDGIINSVIINLRNHIRKEDDEFFAMVNDDLTDEDKKVLLDRMQKMDATHVPAEVGDRKEKIVSPFLANRGMLDAERDFIKDGYINDDWGCHCNDE